MNKFYGVIIGVVYKGYNSGIVFYWFWFLINIGVVCFEVFIEVIDIINFNGDMVISVVFFVSIVVLVVGKF